MSYAILIIQGALFGLVAGWSYPINEYTAESLGLIALNAFLVVMYGVFNDD